LRKENEQLKLALKGMVDEEKKRIAKKEKQLQNLVDKAGEKLANDAMYLDTLNELLETQKDLIEDKGSFLFAHHLKRIKQELLETGQLTKNEIEDLCALKSQLVIAELKNKENYQLYIEMPSKK